jgi:hypothetical protein
VTGYSATPLACKLGIKDDMTLVLLNAPGDLLDDLPSSVTVKHRAGGRADVVVAFFTRRAKVEARLDSLAAMVFPSGSLWIAWPKRTSGRETDLTDNAVREAALHRGLVDNKVCAVDATWSALRLVWRRENRGGIVVGLQGRGLRRRRSS